MKKSLVLFLAFVLCFIVTTSASNAAKVGTADRTIGNITVGNEYGTNQYYLHVNTQATKDYRPVRGGITLKSYTPEYDNVQKFSTIHTLMSNGKSYIVTKCSEDKIHPENIGRTAYFYFYDSGDSLESNDNFAWTWTINDSAAIDLVAELQELDFINKYQKGNISVKAF